MTKIGGGDPENLEIEDFDILELLPNVFELWK